MATTVNDGCAVADRGTAELATWLTLISHASTDAVRAARFPADEPIDAPGAAAAAALAGATRPVDRIWTSPALRARQTSAALGLNATIEAKLRDQDTGRWAGSSFAAIQAKEPEAIAAWLGDPAAAPPDGESVLQLLVRVASWFDGQSNERGRALAVTHPAVIRAAVIHAIHATPASFWRIDVAPLSQAVLSHGGGQWRLRALGPLTRV